MPPTISKSKGTNMQNEMTPNRERLTDLQRHLADTTAKVDAKHALANRLDRVHSAVSPARAELAAFDAQNAVALANWSRGMVNGSPLPHSNGARRKELADAIIDAEVASAAAVVAQEEFRQRAVAEAAPLAPLHAEIREVERLIILEDAAALLPKVREAIAAAHSLHRQIVAARSAAMLNADLSEFRELGAALVKFDDAQAEAEAVPRDDALDNIRPRHVDQMAAQVAAVMSFPTTITSRHRL
jgi:hypothetical protein